MMSVQQLPHARWGQVAPCPRRGLKLWLRGILISITAAQGSARKFLSQMITGESMDATIEPNPAGSAGSCSEPARKPYAAPTLTDFGSLVELTHGAIGAGGDIGIYS